MTSNRSVKSIKSIELKNIYKIYGQKIVLSDINLTFNSGEITALTGNNGAGKSTLLGVLSTAVKASSGIFKIDGTFVGSDFIRLRTGYLSHDSFLYSDLTCSENFRMYADLYGLDKHSVVLDLKERFKLTHFFDDRQVKELSRGQRQRAALARAFIAKPDILLLDEPLSGLDSTAINMVSAIIKEHSKSGGVVIFSSHNKQFVNSVADRVISLKNGSIISDGFKIPKDFSESVSGEF